MARAWVSVALCLFAARAVAAPCALEPRDREWLQHALDAWSRLSGPILGADKAPLPWMVLYDQRCVWHVEPAGDVEHGTAQDLGLRFEGAPVRVVAAPHGGEIELPSGKKVPPAIAAATSLYDDNRKTFFFAALPGVWRAGAGDLPRPEAFALGVVAHELVHTLQLVPLVSRLEAVQEKFRLPTALDDDIIQERFSKNRAFVRAYERERDALDAALKAPAATRPRLARRALRLIRARQDRFYRGKDRGYRDLEEIFLAMEGLAVWAHFRLAEDRPEQVYFEDKRDHYWSQSEGFALVRLVELLEVPGWRRRLLPPELASPLALLDDTVAR